MVSLESVTSWLESHPEPVDSVAKVVRGMQARRHFSQMELKGPHARNMRRWMSWVTDWKKSNTQHGDQYVTFQQPGSSSELTLSIEHAKDPHDVQRAYGSIELNGQTVFADISEYTEGWNNKRYNDFHIEDAKTARVLKNFFGFTTEADAHAWCNTMEEHIFCPHDAAFSWQMGKIEHDKTPSPKRHKPAQPE